MPKCDKCNSEGIFLKVVCCQECQQSFCEQCGFPFEFIPNEVLDEIREYKGEELLSEQLPKFDHSVGELLLANPYEQQMHNQELKSVKKAKADYKKGAITLCEKCYSKARRTIIIESAYDMWNEKEYRGAIDLLSYFELNKTLKRMQNEGIEEAQRNEKLKKFEAAAKIYEELDMDKDAIRCREKDIERNRPKVKLNADKILMGDDRSVKIDNSVLNRSSINNAGSSFTCCPYCGKDIDLPKTPKFCPFCKERLGN